MASGPVCRTNRPNTWLHRPICKREESSCQLGAVHTWHLADIRAAAAFVRFWTTRTKVDSGRDGLSANDPKRHRIAQRPPSSVLG